MIGNRVNVEWPADGLDPEVGQHLPLVGQEDDQLVVKRREPSGHITAETPNGDEFRGLRLSGRKGFFMQRL